MRKASKPNGVKNFDRSAKVFKDQPYLLKLYVTGLTIQSVHAINNLKEICEEYLKGRYDLEVIDLY